MTHKNPFESNAPKRMVMVFGVAFLIVMLMFVMHTFGTTPADITSIQGEYRIVMNNGHEMLHLSVDQNNYATVNYRGIRMAGTIARSMTTQEVATYELHIEESSIGNPEELTFSIGLPPSDHHDDPVGTWCIRFRNAEIAGDDYQPQMMFLLGLTSPQIQSTTFENALADELPGELFDWFYLENTGTGLELNERSIPIAGTKEALGEYARAITWTREGNGVHLHEV